MSKIRELDGLRGLLAVWVVGVHLLPSVGIDAARFGPLSPLFGEHLRVQIFCILSGFVIFLMLDRRQPGYGAFVAGRIRRLYPVYILAFALSVLMADLVQAALAGSPFQGLRLDSRLRITEAAAAQPMAHVLAHVTLLHGVIPRDLLPEAAYSFLGQAWNISTEFQFYVLAPLLFAGLMTGPVWRRVGVGLLCLGLWQLGLRYWDNPASLARYAPYFALGIASFLAWRRDWRDPGQLTGVRVGFLGVVVFLGIDLAAGIWVFLLGRLVLRRDQGRGLPGLGWLASRPMLWLGQISYALYLLHMIPLYLGMYLLNGLDLGRGAYLACLSLFTFALSLPLSWLVCIQIEQRFAPPSAPKPAGAAHPLPAGQASGYGPA